MEDDWIEPWPRRRPRNRRPNRPTKRRDIQPQPRHQKIRALQDDRAETYCHYSCSTCDNDNSCCRCPDPRPLTPVPQMYIIDMCDGTVRRLTYYETIATLNRKTHDIAMEQYIGRSFWKGLVEDRTAWHPGPPDPLHVRYAKPKFSLFDVDDYDD